MYTDDDIELIQAGQDADELHAISHTDGKAIDAEAREGLQWIADNTLGGSLTYAMTVWLHENGYATGTMEAQDTIFRTIFPNA